MKTATEVVLDVYALANVPEVTNAITGEVCQFFRPNDSVKQDIVIGILGVDNEWMQQATVNVKIHVPNLKDGQGDLASLDMIAGIVIPLLDSQYRDSFYTMVSETFLRQDTDGTWFYRIVVDYYSIQENFKNI